jgi:hypothetical protein
MPPEMFCRRVGTLTKRSRDELEELKKRHREITERLVDNYRSVLERIDPDGPAAIQERAALHAARDAVAAAGSPPSTPTSTRSPLTTATIMCRCSPGIFATTGRRCWP